MFWFVHCKYLAYKIRLQWEMCTIQNNGNMYCAGTNTLGTLGTGDYTNHFSPTLVPGGLSYADVCTAGVRNTITITTLSDDVFLPCPILHVRTCARGISENCIWYFTYL